MTAQVYLLRSGAVQVLAPGAEAPIDYLAHMQVDAGVVDDWPFIVRMAEYQMLANYCIADGSARKIERHCGDDTFKIEKKRFNTSGEAHKCHRRTR